MKRELKKKFREMSLGKGKMRKGNLRRRWGGYTLGKRGAAQTKEGEVEGCREGLREPQWRARQSPHCQQRVSSKKSAEK